MWPNRLAFAAFLAGPPLLLLGACDAARETSAPAASRTYFVAAEEVVWDYAPSGADGITGKPFEGFALYTTTPGHHRIGRTYRKAIYREYTDSTFTTVKSRPPEWAHLGILGPLLRATVGDTLRIMFQNNATRPFSMHPHGVFYQKDAEGAGYADGTSGVDRADDAVPPGGMHLYIWPVPDRAGPAPGDGSSVLWMYHSHVDEGKDVNAGLIGPMIITARGSARPDGSPQDVDRELVTMFGEMDENVSWYFEDNLHAYAQDPGSAPREATFADPFYLLNLKESINGFIYGNTPGLTMREGDRVRWYVFSSNNFEIHAPHWHGQTAVAQHMRTDVLSLVAMEMVVADMVPDNPGVWLFHCHVAPHLDAGMQALFEVQPSGASVR